MTEHNLKTLEYDKIIAQLVELAYTETGRKACQDLLPSSDLKTVRERLKQTSDAVSILLGKGSPPLHGIAHVEPFVRRAGRGSDLSMAELMRTASFLRAVSRMARILPENGAGGNLVYEAVERLTVLPALERRLDRSIISEDEMADEASQDLARIRQQQKRAQQSIRDALDRLLHSKARFLQEQLITQRDGRYVLPVRAEYRNQVPGIVHDASGSGQTLFVEPLAVVEANNRLRELEAEERAEIERIIHELSTLVAEQADVILVNAGHLRDIDFAVAKGRLALKMKAMPPELNDEGKINLIKARHPLIPDDEVVPINLWLGEDFHTLVITGPNTGGKTVALKTCGLLTLMAMAGLEIPCAEHSRVAVFGEVFADIGDEQSIEQSLSTFSSHMRNIVRITEQAGPDSLVLTDELGGGTDPSEGAALAISILDYLLKAGCRTVATTHYKELKAYALETALVENASCEFDTETLKPTYRLLIGAPGVSNAFIISQKLGLNDRIIERAGTLLDDETVHFENLVRRLDESQRESDEARRQIQREQAALAEERRELEAARVELEQEKADAAARVREEEREALREKLQVVDELIEEIRSGSGSGRDFNDGQSLKRELRRDLNKVESDISRETLKPRQAAASPGRKPDRIVVGETYEAPGLGLTGKAMTEPDSKGQVLIAQGVLQVRVDAAALLYPAKRPDSKPGRTYTQKRPSRSATFRPEIKLLGQTSAEAVSNLDQYLDDAVLASAQSVRIVHGKGSGVLRDAVADFLRRDSRVRSYHLAAYGEGDTGVTIAELAR